MGSRKNTLIKNISETNVEVLNIAVEKIGTSNDNDILVLSLDIIPVGRINFSDSSKNKIVFHMMNNDRNPIYNSDCISNLGKFNEVKFQKKIKELFYLL